MSGMTAATATTLALTAVATAASIAGQIYSQGAQEKSAKASAAYNAQVAANEAATQQTLAQNEIAKGVADKERQQRNALRQMGEMRAGIGASGFEMDSGSMESLLAESATEHQYDSNIITQNAAQAAWQHQVGQTSALNSQDFATWQGTNASSGRAGALIGVGGSLLSGISTGVSSYSALKDT